VSGGDYKVGYGRPPKEHQFKKGQSGWPAGRRKRAGAVCLDLDELLEKRRPYRDARGRRRYASRSELLFRRQVELGLGGDLRSLKSVLKQLMAYEAVQLTHAIVQDHGVIEVPRDIPMDLAEDLINMFGRPPWMGKQIAAGCIRWERRDPEAAKAFMAERFGQAHT
jgi:hypothetical protein